MSVNDGTKEYFEKLKLAEEFCNGDVEKAKKMLNGEFRDIIIIKGRFEDDGESIYGFFYSFLSAVSYMPILNDIKITDYTSVMTNKPFNEWKLFLERFERPDLQRDIDPGDMARMNYRMKLSLDITTAVSIIQWVESNSITEITERFSEILTEIMEKPIKVDLDFEKTTSLILHELKMIR
jgi:hypothetical protein